MADIPSAIVRWEHRRGGEAHALVRLLPADADRPPVGMVSELRGNPDHLGIGSDFAAAAQAALAALAATVQLDPESVVWIAHRGPFSYYDAGGPDVSYTLMDLRWDGSRYHDQLADHRLLTKEEIMDLLGETDLDPVPDAVRDVDEA